MSTITGLDFVTHPTSATAGETANFTFGRTIYNNYWATLEYKFGSYRNGTDFGTADGTIFTKQKNITSYSWNVPMQLLNRIPSATSGTWTLRLSTYISSSATTPVEWATVQITIKAGADIKPVVSGTGINIVKPYTENGVDYLLTGVSALSVSITAYGRYSSTISRRFARLEDRLGQFVRNITGSSTPITVTDLAAGEYSLSRSVVHDSRARISDYYYPSTAIEFEVLEYYQPTLSTVTAERVRLVDGQYVTDPVNGQYARVSASMTPGPNRFSYGNMPIKVTVTSVDEQYEGIFYIANNTPTVLKDGNSQDVVFSLKKGYRIRFEALDTVVTNASYGLVPNAMMSALNSTVALIMGRDFARGIAFGKYAETDNLFEIEPLWDIKKKGSIEADFITENTTDSNGWTVIKTRLGLKIGIKSFEFTDVAFDSTSASGSIYRAIKLVDLPSGFVPTKIYATSDNSTRWIISASYFSLTSKVSLTFGSGENTQVSSLKGDILIIGFETQGE